MDSTKYTATHTVDLPTEEWGIRYLYPLPELASGLCPVLVQEEKGEAKLLLSIEKALEQMTDEAGRYTITLYPDTSVTKKNKIAIFFITIIFF